MNQINRSIPRFLRPLALACFIVTPLLPIQSLYASSNYQSGSDASFLRFETLTLYDRGCVESMAWGDVNKDGYLDLAVGHSDGANLVYLNQQGTLPDTATWSAVEDNDETYTVAWGDVDGNGFLDLVVGNRGQPDRIYFHDSESLSVSAGWVSQGVSSDGRIALADIDLDGDLDMAGSSDEQPFVLHMNQNSVLVPLTLTFPNGSPIVSDVKWIDLDQDGDPDLTTSDGGTVRYFPNNGGMIQTSADWSIEATNTILDFAWDDLNNDGTIDLALTQVVSDSGTIMGSQHSWWLNQNDTLQNAGTVDLAGLVQALVVGDMDNDGDEDLVAGRIRTPTGPDNEQLMDIRLNFGGAFDIGSGGSFVFETDNTHAVALGDIDNDGDLDMAVGNCGNSSRIYINQMAGYDNRSELLILDEEKTNSSSMAWGDVDNDGDLDMVIGYNTKKNGIYRNNDGAIDPTAIWEAPQGFASKSVAWGDVDGDNDLDLAVGNYQQSNQLFINENGQLGATASWESADFAATTTISFGDVDNDGDLDLAVGNELEPNQLFLNFGGVLGAVPSWESQESDETTRIVWGDIDKDGALDLVVGNHEHPNRIYQNIDGKLEKSAYWSSQELEPTVDLVVGDAGNDGDLDIAVANSRPSNCSQQGVNCAETIRIYENINGTINRHSDKFYTDGLKGAQVVLDWVDVDNNGTLDLAAKGDSFNFEVLADRRPLTSTTHTTEPRVALQILPDSSSTQVLPQSNLGYASSDIRNGIIPIQYTFDFSNGPMIREVRGWYSLNGGGQWLPAIPTSETQTTSFPIPNLGDPSSNYIFYWDVNSSSFFGQSDNVIFRIEAELACANNCERTTVSAQTYPLRIRGTQIRVMDSGGEPASGAIIYQLPTSASKGAELITDLSGIHYLTNGTGYLQGRGALEIGDRLIALDKIEEHEKFTVYRTSAEPVVGGLDLASSTVGDLAVQALTVSNDNPLILFHLDVSLEWDARNDLLYLDRLVFDIQRASELIYDWTNGQAALGNITIHHAKQQWENADIRIYATNSLRPHATIGGIVRSGRLHEVTLNGETSSLYYAPGHINMGATWNRYGNAGDSLSEDWARTLAHELGHYLFFLFDNYIGQANGSVVQIEGCPGVMSDPYSDVDSEFHPATRWAESCSETLSNQFLGQADWETISEFYPWIQSPSGAINEPADAGPNNLPLAVTQIGFAEMFRQPTTVDVSTYILSKADGTPYIAGSGARAYLFQDDGDSITDLGIPRRDRLQARNASPSDLVCIYELSAQPMPLAGCETVSNGDTEIALSAYSGWQPDVLIEPSGSAQITATVENVASGLPLMARLYASDALAGDDAQEAVPLTEQSDGSYRVMIESEQLLQEAYIHIYDSTDPARGFVTNYTLGGAPVLTLGNEDTIELPNGGTLTRQDGTVLTLGNGDVLTLGNGNVGIRLDDGRVFYMGAGDNIAFGTGTVLTLGNGDVLTLGNGDVLTLGNGDVTLTHSTGEVLTLGNGDVLTLGNGDVLTLGNGDVLTLGNGDARLLTEGSVAIWLNDGSVLTLGNGDVLTLGNGDVLTLGNGDILTLGNGDVLTLGNGDIQIQQLDGTVLTLGNGDILTLGNGDAFVLYGDGPKIWGLDGDVLTLGNGDVLTLGNGDVLTLGNGDVLTLGNGDVLTLGNGDTKLIGNINTSSNAEVLTLGNGNAPVRSGDGQVTIYADHREFEPNEFYIIQSATLIPSPPSWAAIVGQAYRITASLAESNLPTASISINYLGRNIDDDRENLLHIYYFDLLEAQWTELDTDVDEYHNRALADAQGPGIYALMYSIDIPLANTGWNLIAYPLNHPTAVSDAFDSIDGEYSSVYGYNAFEADELQRWEIYDTASPAWVNDLIELTSGRGYWINVNVTTTLKLQDLSAASAAVTSSTPLSPPATFYGVITDEQPKDVYEEMIVQAWIGDVLCGETKTQEIDGQSVYAVKVYADGTGSIRGCGEAGNSVRFTLNGQALPASTVAWVNDGAKAHNLLLDNVETSSQYLPFVTQ